MQDIAFWHQVMNTISEGLFMVDSQGHICELNQALCELTGYKSDELLGQPCSIFQCDACAEMRDEAIASWCHLFTQKEVVRRRCHILHKDGTRIPILKNAKLLLRESSLERGGGTPSQDAVFSVETIADIRELVQKDAYIHKVERLLQPAAGFEGMAGTSAPMQRMFRLLEQAAQSSAPVLILGESGTGKELAAQALHRLSTRRGLPFVELNCAALNEHVLESELFGHVKGAFTGAIRDRAGRFEAAHGGTLFLDEIGDIPLSTQVKILRVLETGTIHKVGSNKPAPVNVRIVSATNRDLPALIEQGLFREDLAFRINVIPIHLPPLRERDEDIPLLVQHFLRTMREFSRCKADRVSPELLQAFKSYHWPGNVRELRNLLEYGAAMSSGGHIGLEHMPEKLCGAAFDAASGVPLHPPGFTEPQPVAVSGSLEEKQAGQRKEIFNALEQTGGNVSRAAKLLGIHRTTLVNRMLRLGISVRKNVHTG